MKGPTVSTHRSARIAVVSALLALIAGCSSQPAAPKIRQVDYVIGGTAKHANITYANETGGSEIHDVTVPTTIRLNLQVGSFLQITAIDQDPNTTITCTIDVDGVAVQHGSGQDAGGFAGCQGTLQ